MVCLWILLSWSAALPEELACSLEEQLRQLQALELRPRFASYATREAKLSPRSKALWDEYFSKYSKDFREDFDHMSLNEINHWWAAKRDGDPFIVYLEQYGLDLEKGTAPDIKALLDDYLSGMRELVEQGRVEEDSVLIPARVFELSDGMGTRKVYVPPGEEIPEGAVPSVSILSSGEFSAMVKAGFYPLGESHSGVLERKVLRHRNLTHDLAHFFSFRKDPDYMAAVKDLYSKPEVAKIEELPIGSPLWEVAEDLTFTNKEGLARVLPKDLDLTKDWTLDLTMETINGMSGRNLASAIENLWKNRFSLVHAHGGVVNDSVLRGYLEQSYIDQWGHQGLLGLIAHAERARRRYKAASWFSRGGEKRQMRRALARAQTALIEFSKIGMEEWIRDISSGKPPKGSKVYKLVCETGIWNFANVRYEKFCK